MSARTAPFSMLRRCFSMTDMSRLGIDFAGVHFKNPIIPASGTFGYGREFEEF